MTISDLPPWDQLPYYALPVESVVAVTGTAVQAVKGDPKRVLLIMYQIGNAAGALVASTTPQDAGVSGIQLNTGTLPFILDIDTHGPLVCQPWWLSATMGGGGNVTVISHSLIRWPTENDLSPLEVIDRAFIATGSGRTNGNGSVRRFDADSWAKSAQTEADDIAADIERCQRGFGYARDGNLWLPPSRWRPAAHP